MTASDQVQLGALDTPAALTPAQRRQRVLAPLRTGAHSRAIRTDTRARLTFLGVSRSQWARRIRGVGKANPHLLAPTGYVHPRYRPAIARYVLLTEIFARLTAQVDADGLTAKSGEPARSLTEIRAYNREITRLEAALGIFSDHADPDPLATLIGGGDR